MPGDEPSFLRAPALAFAAEPGARARPQPGHVEIWRVDLDAPASPDAADRLTPQERDRAERYRFDVDRRRFIAGRLALRRVIARYAGGAGEGALAWSDLGQPRLIGPAAGLAISLSRAEGQAGLAVATAGAIGFDIEPVRERADLDLVAREQFSPAERAEIDGLPAAARLEGFYRAWTAREALVKATGEGLSGALERLTVVCDPSRPAALLAGFGAYDPARWGLAAFGFAPGVLASVALGGRVTRLEGLIFGP